MNTICVGFLANMSIELDGDKTENGDAKDPKKVYKNSKSMYFTPKEEVLKFNLARKLQDNINKFKDRVDVESVNISTTESVVYLELFC
jgi:hypothetical protein